MSKAIRELCYERSKICAKLVEADDKLKAVQKERDMLKAKLDLRDEMLNKLIDEEIEEGNLPKITAEVVGKWFYTKDGIEVIVRYTANNYRLLGVMEKTGVGTMLTLADIDWDTEHQKCEQSL